MNIGRQWECGIGLRIIKRERRVRTQKDRAHRGAHIGEDLRQRKVEPANCDCTKAKMQAEPVVTLLKKHTHTQVNYYPYESLTTVHSHTTTT